MFGSTRGITSHEKHPERRDIKSSRQQARRADASHSDFTIGPLLDAMEPGIHCVRTHWIWGFMAFQLVRRTRTVRLMVPMCPESGFLGRVAWPRPHS
jgi:hypothetical protein